MFSRPEGEIECENAFLEIYFPSAEKVYLVMPSHQVLGVSAER